MSEDIIPYSKMSEDQRLILADWIQSLHDELELEEEFMVENGEWEAEFLATVRGLIQELSK